MTKRPNRLTWMSQAFFLFWVMAGVSAFAAESPKVILEWLKDPNDHCTTDKMLSRCDEAIIKGSVDWACRLVEKDGVEALTEIQLIRFNCCGEPNYVWVNDMAPKMIMHPVKASLNGKDLSENKDPSGKRLFVEFVEAVKRTPSGEWVEYLWPKAGETKPSTKKSWVRKCKAGNTDQYWVVGSGTWK